MRENRHIRFTDIAGLTRHDLPLAGEIWLSDLSKQSWATTNMLKLANYFKRYMEEPDPRLLDLNQMESRCNIDKDQISQTVRQMQMFGIITGYSVENGTVRASLNLTVMQRLQVMEVSRKLAQFQALENRDVLRDMADKSDYWVPEQPELEEQPA